MRIEFANYPTHASLLGNEPVKYYWMDAAPPAAKKYADTRRYQYRILTTQKEHGLALYDRKEGAFVVANPRSAGQPKRIAIAGNLLYSSAHHYIRQRVMETLHSYFNDNLPAGPSINTPCILGFIVCGPVGKFDLDNYWIYYKALQDCLVRQGYLPEDTVEYVVGVHYRFQESKERKFVLNTP